MYSQEDALALVELIYGAAGEPQAWPAVLQQLAGVMHGNVCTIHHQDLRSLESSFAADWNMDPAAIESYTKYYGPLNVWFTTRPELNIQGNVYTSQMLCPDYQLMRTEFYNDWCRPNGMRQGAGATVLKNGRSTAVLSVFSWEDRAPFGEDELELLRLLMPHLQRAFQLHNRIRGLETKADAAAEALDQLSEGVILLDAKGCVLLVNQAATVLFASEKCITLTSRGLAAAIPSENRQLNALIRGAIATGKGSSFHSGGAVTISRNHLRRPLQVLVTPLRTKVIHVGKHVPVVAVFVSDPEQKLASAPAVFAQLFGLTRAEARLAAILASGSNLKEASDQLSVAESTVRSQLKSVYAKTNTNRQSQLVRLLLLTPARLSPARENGACCHYLRRQA